MTRALAIETSGRVGSVALVEDEWVVAEEAFEHGLKHAAAIVSMIDRLCRGRACRPAELAEVYVSAGPGSFTGLRIGITLAKTLALATGAKVVAVPSVRVLAENAPADARDLIIVLDAKRGQIFTARFERAEEGSVRAATVRERGRLLTRAARSEPWIEREPAHLDTLAAMLARSPRPVHLLGEGVRFHEESIPTDDPAVIVTPEASWRARASAVARVGVALSRAGEYADPDRLTPIYIRLPEAEEKWRAARAGEG